MCIYVNFSKEWKLYVVCEIWSKLNEQFRSYSYFNKIHFLVGGRLRFWNYVIFNNPVCRRRQDVSSCQIWWKQIVSYSTLVDWIRNFEILGTKACYDLRVQIRMMLYTRIGVNRKNRLNLLNFLFNFFVHGMLDFEKNDTFYLATVCEVARWIYIVINIWWKSDDRFRSYSKLCEFQNGAPPSWIR